MCSSLIYPHSTNHILNLWRHRCHSVVDAKAPPYKQPSDLQDGCDYNGSSVASGNQAQLRKAFLIEMNLLFLLTVGRTSHAVVHPMVPQHAINRHTIVSQITFDDMECAIICIKHSSCYSFNFHSFSRLCELNYARKADFPIYFSYNRDSVYSELDFVPDDTLWKAYKNSVLQGDFISFVKPCM